MGAKTASIIITSCGKRKSLEAPAALRAASLGSGHPAAVAEKWAARVGSAEHRIPAHQLYQGRAFREARNAATHLGSSVYILSAGLGLIPAELEIPSYSLTVADGADNILRRLSAAEPASAWWRELTKVLGAPTFEDLLRSSSGPILVAAGSAYLSMIANDLVALPACERDRLRLFTAAPASSIPVCLRGVVMPYDPRLESVAGRSGTLSDFAQRALRHFSEIILPADREGNARDHATAVLKSLEGLEAPVRRRGTSMGDTEIVALIQQHWRKAEGKSARMLRLLRDSFEVACEQNRFKKLFAQARSGIAA